MDNIHHIPIEKTPVSQLPYFFWSVQVQFGASGRDDRGATTACPPMMRWTKPRADPKIGSLANHT